MDTSLTLKDLFEILESFAVVVASIAAVWGINTWRREAKWKRKYELIEETLYLFYQCRECISHIRHPASNSTEGTSRTKRDDETPDEAEILNRAYVVYERYERDKEIFMQLTKIKHRFRAVFGKESINPFLDIERIMNEIFIATNLLARVYWPRQGKNMSDHEFDSHIKGMEKYESIFWATLDSDPLDIRVQEAISKIETFCNKALKR